MATHPANTLFIKNRSANLGSVVTTELRSGRSSFDPGRIVLVPAGRRSRTSLLAWRHADFALHDPPHDRLRPRAVRQRFVFGYDATATMNTVGAERPRR